MANPGCPSYFNAQPLGNYFTFTLFNNLILLLLFQLSHPEKGLHLG